MAKKIYPKPGEIGTCSDRKCKGSYRVDSKGYIRPHQVWNETTKQWVTCGGSDSLPRPLN